VKLLNSARIYLYLIVLLILVNINAFGLPPSVYWSNKTDWIDHNDSRYYEQVIKKYKSEIDNFEWGKIFKGLADDFKETNVDWSGKLEIKQKFKNELDSLVNDYMEAAEWAGVENGKRDDKILKKFKTGRFQAAAAGKIIYFSGRPNEIKLDTNDINEEQAKDLRYRAETVDALLNNFKGEARRKTVNAISKAEAKWKNYLGGFSQYPWESFVNSYITSCDIQNPPGYQWVIFHPELGVEVSTDGIKQLKAKEVLAIELLGWIKYYGEDLRNFWGISGITTIRDDIGIGIGGMIHLGSYINLGITWHDIDNDDNFFNDDLFVTFGIDLFSFSKPTNPKFEKKVTELNFRKRFFMLVE
jgi:hypothetical protein